MEKEELNNPEFEGMTMKEKKKALAHKKRLEHLAIEDRISHLERFENEDKNHKFNVTLNNIIVFKELNKFDGPIKDRKVTDKRWIYPLVVLLTIFILHGFSGKNK